MSTTSFLLVLVASAAGGGIGAFLRSFITTKGQNLATRQDIADITRAQEEMKHQFNVLIEESKQKHSLRTLAADKRLEAHQGAFKRIKKLLSAGRDTAVIDEIYAWMDDNCLYLSAEARIAVWAAIGHANARASQLAEIDNVAVEPKHRMQYDDLAMKNFEAIMAALKPVVDGVDLPALGADELELIAANARVDVRDARPR
jgi:hypothetical protein